MPHDSRQDRLRNAGIPVGTYSDKIDYNKFRVLKFSPFLFASKTYHGKHYGCGATALSMLTGISPFTISIDHPSQHWSDKYMVKFLEKKKFKVAPLTVRGLTRWERVVVPIANDHIILAKSQFMKNNASWVILFNGLLFHMFDVIDFNPLELLNHPLLKAYLVKPPIWFSEFQSPPETEGKSVKERKATKRTMTIRELSHLLLGS